MSNPFDDPEGQFVVLTNHEEQYSLWPQAMQIPGGWTRRFGPESRSACLSFVEKSWTDMRPLSVRERAAEAN